jgi:hypothetical protein
MKKFLLHLVAMLFYLSATAQEIKPETIAVALPDIHASDSTSYAAGVYATLQDFLAKKPSRAARNAPIYREKGFFYFKLDPTEKIRAFAVSHNGTLYFQIRAIMDHKMKSGRSESHFNPNLFVPVLVEGKNYSYTESDFGNVWAMSTNRGAGNPYQRISVIWDKSKMAFRIMKFCEDFNDFIRPLKPEFVQQCDKRESPNSVGIRDAVIALNSQ